jgi:hypothetical protein
MFIRQLDEINWDGFKSAHYLNTNTIDPDTDLDGSEEFGDYDDPYLGLTIISPANTLEAVRFLNGYAI